MGVGPVGSLGDSAELLARLAQLPNVHLLGNRALGTLPAYVQHMDVCLMPYLVNGYTKFINPIKMYEYLATGRPIVSTPIDSVIPFADVVRVARTVEEWEAVMLAMQGAQERDGTRALRAARAPVNTTGISSPSGSPTNCACGSISRSLRRRRG